VPNEDSMWKTAETVSKKLNGAQIVAVIIVCALAFVAWHYFESTKKTEQSPGTSINSGNSATINSGNSFGSAPSHSDK